MPSPSQERSLPLKVPISHPQLLAGLDAWLHLGLISDERVKQLSQAYLSCPVPEPVVIPTLPATQDRETDFAPEASDRADRERQPLLRRVWQSFKQELSVRWLLFLGVFLVIVSSGVLAATQWDYFPISAQYGVLGAYTLAFWGVGLWAQRQANLQLTAQTLQAIALLLVPVNFWAMDGFRLWTSPVGWATVAIASLVFSVLSYRQVRVSHPFISSLAFLGFSYLHWGWTISRVPVAAVYLGAIACFFLVTIQRRRTSQSVNSGLILYALSILIVRAIWVLQLPLSQFGLALGLCGWLFTDLAEQDYKNTEQSRSSLSPLWEIIGGSFLLFGWWVSVWESFPWQAVVVSGLGLGFFARRLQRHWFAIDVVALFLVGLQSLFLLWRLLPFAWRSSAIALLMQLTEIADYNSPALVSLLLFPYIWIWIGITEKLYQIDRAATARFAARLTLGFGILLTLVSLVNPSLRSLNLLLSSATLAFIILRRPSSLFLVYFTHTTGILTLYSCIDWGFSNLDPTLWAVITLVLMFGEWGVSLRQFSDRTRGQRWYWSSWHFGFILAGLSYVLLWNEGFFWQDLGLVWLLTPLTLTGVASRTRNSRRQVAAWASLVTLVIAQFLTLALPAQRIMNLAVATSVMIANSRYLRREVVAGIHIAFALAFVTAIFWEPLSETDWFVVCAIALIALWEIQNWWRSRPDTFSVLYARASARWAIFLCGLTLLSLTAYAIAAHLDVVSPDWQSLVTPLLVAGAIIYRDWHFPNPLAIYACGWFLELAIAQVNLLVGGTRLTLATANISLALLMLFLSNQFLTSRLRQLRSIQGLPLVYALLGLSLRLDTFTPYTGFLTLGAALTGIGVGQKWQRKLITYLSIAGITVAWYELVIYQLLQQPGDHLADGLTILATVAVAIALAYRLFSQFWHASVFGLSRREIVAIAHLHWGIAALLMAIVISLSTFTPPRLIGLGMTIGLILLAYAFMQGKTAGVWVYLGWIEVIATVLYLRFAWPSLSLLDPVWGIIASAIAYLIYQLPWQQWGWIAQPWRKSAIILPIATIFLTLASVSAWTLLVTAGFYAWVSQQQSHPRWTYLSLGLIDWAAIRWFSDLQLDDPIWYASVIGLSVLYIAQVDPSLKPPQRRKLRHRLRTLGSTLICGVAFLYHSDPGWLPGILSLVFIFCGIGLQIRAFLLVGTATLVITVCDRLILFSSEYAFAKWLIGLVVGVILIAIAANFERRREQIVAVVQTWLNQLQAWE